MCALAATSRRVRRGGDTVRRMGRYTLRTSEQLDARLRAHFVALRERAERMGVPAPKDAAIVLALLERGLDAYAKAFGESEQGRGPEGGG